MTAEFAGKTAIVTGAGSGIGAEIARRRGAAGCRVVVADLNGEAAAGVANRNARQAANGGQRQRY